MRDVTLFRHPHLVRGIVHTPRGNFAVVRGLVQMPDELGKGYGWVPVVLDDQPVPALPTVPTPRL
jgi:hypothetical protein